jgi:hypothetical protein
MALHGSEYSYHLGATRSFQRRGRTRAGFTSAAAALVGLLLASGTADAATESNFAGSCSTPAGWISVGNVEGSPDGSSATIALGVLDITAFITCTDYGFNIPPGSTIDSITLTIRRGASGDGNTFQVQTGPLKGGVLVAAPTLGSHFGGALSSETLPISGDELWGETWTPEDINDDDDFGAALRITVPGLGPPFNAQPGTVSIDSVEITVTYREVPVPALDTVWLVLVALGLATIGILSLRRRQFRTPSAG